MGVLTGTDLILELEREDLGQQALVEGLIFKDTINMFYSEPGAGKSVIAVCMMAQMSRGLPVFGLLDVKKPVKCSYMQLEGSKSEQLNRLKSMRQVINFDATNISWHDTPLYVESEKSFKQNMAELKKASPEVVFIDSMYCLTSSGLSGEKGFLPVRNMLQMLKNELRCTFIILHHSAKPVYQEGKLVEVNDPFLGSQYLKAFLDMMFFVRRIDKNRSEMKATKQSRNAEGIDKIVLNFSKTNWVVSADKDHTEQPANIIILEYLKDKFRKGVHPTTLMMCEELDLTDRHIKRLKAAGYFDEFVTFEIGGHGKGNATKWLPKS